MLDVFPIEEHGVEGVFLAVDGLYATVVSHATPIIVGTISVNIVAADIVSAGHVHIGGVVGCGGVGNGHLCHPVLAAGLGGGFIIVVHHVDISSARTAIASSASPIEDETVAEIHVLGLNGILPPVFVVLRIGGISCPIVARAVESGRTIVGMRNHVVVEAGQLAAPYSAIAVCSLAVPRVVQAFAHGAPLQGGVVVVV